MEPITLILFGLAALAAARKPKWWIVRVNDAGEGDQGSRWFVAGQGDGAKELWSKLLSLTGLEAREWKAITAPNELPVIVVQGRSPTLTKGFWLPAAYFLDSEQADEAEDKLREMTKAGFKDPNGATHAMEWRSVQQKIPRQVMTEAGGSALPASVSGDVVTIPPGVLGALSAIRR